MTDAQELVMFACNDLSGITRGKAFPIADLPARLTAGVGWVPANQSLTPFNVIAEADPFGAVGDLRLMPVPETKVRVEGRTGSSPLHFYLSDIVHTDGTPWEACGRNFLRQALADLEREAGLRLLVSFEQEFVILDRSDAGHPAFSLEALRSVDELASAVVSALRQANIAVDQFLPEYGANQYELTIPPSIGIAAADAAVITRSVLREAARQSGHRISLAPKPQPDGVGNGLHIHFSFRDRQDRPVTGSGLWPKPVSEVAGQFVAGLIRHMPALCALTAPSVTSYLRLKPHNWSAAYTCFGYRNREATVRVCPVLELPGMDPAEQANLEFRAADATASPYIALGALVRAGLEGIRKKYAVPPLLDRDPDGLGEAERQRLGIARLPDSLPGALDALAADAVANGWFPVPLLTCYRAMKQTEIKLCAGLSPAELCDKYARIY